MTDDPIKAALAEAGAAIYGWMENPRTAEESARYCAAEAIAAFLRALPDHSLCLVDDHGRAINGAVPRWHGMLANAVERAAREGGG